jgi:outer membrane receptor protein involved in Fe transport
MNNKLFFTLIFAFTLSLNVFSDNPGDEVVSEPVAEEESTETVVASEDTSSDDEAPAPVTTSDDDEVVTLQKVVVTGSRIKRTDVQGALPTIVITKEDIDASGFRSVTEALQSLPQANAYRQDEQNVNTFTPNANEIDLRRIGPGRVLYLINGRRTADYPLPYNNASNFVNTGTVPRGLVDRIEVVSQGSSAIYGSDAVTGVINIITTTGKDFSELEANVSVTEHGNDMISSLTFSTGGFTESSSWTVGLDLTQVDPMYLGDREGFDDWTDGPDYSTTYMNPRWGAAVQMAGFGADTATYRPSDFGGLACDSQELSGGVFRDFSRDKPEVYGVTNYPGSYQGYACMYGRGANGGDTQTIVNEREDVTVMGTFTHNFDNGVQMDARVFYYEDTAYLRSNVSRYVSMGSFLDPVGILSTVIPNDLVPIQFGQQIVYSLRYFTPAMGEAFESKSDYTEDVTDIFMGFSGVFDNGFEWQAGVNATEYNANISRRTLTSGIRDYIAGVGTVCTDSIRADGLCYGSYYAYNFGPSFESLDANYPCGYGVFFGRSNCWDPNRMYGALSEETFDGWLADDSTASASEQMLVDFTMNGEVGDIKGAPIGFALHLEYQTQEYFITPSEGRLDDEQFGGDNAIDFIQGSTRYGGGDRERYSVGVEFSLPLADNIEMGIATRYDKYDDDSSNVGGKVSSMANIAYRPTEDILLRASVSQSFRAPDMHRVYAGSSSAFYGGITDGPLCYVESSFGNVPGSQQLSGAYNFCGATYTQTRRGFSGGNTELYEEEGTNYSFGIVTELAENVSFQWDAYQMVLEEAVRSGSYQELVHQQGVCLYGDSYLTFFGGNLPPADCSQVSELLVRGPTTDPLTGDVSELGPIVSGTMYPYNQTKLEFIGHDSYLTWTKETENAGDFRVSVASSTIVRVNRQEYASAAEVDLLEYFIYEPRSQQNVTVSWSREDQSLALFADRLGHMNMYRGEVSDPHITYNLSYGYDYSPDVNLYLSVRNLTDVMPQKDGGFGYPYYYQGVFSVCGRYVSAGFNYRF